MNTVYLDACVIIEFIEGTALIRSKIANALSGRVLISSELARMESRILAISRERQQALSCYEAFFKASLMMTLNTQVFECATRLRVNHKLKTPDSLHLALALTAGCDEFWTEDIKLSSAATHYLRVRSITELPQPSDPHA